MFDIKPRGIKRKERPRLRWLEVVEKNLREMKVNRWRQKTADREEWMSVITEPKALRELYTQGLCMRLGRRTLFNCLKDSLCERVLCLPSTFSGLLCYITANSVSGGLL
jgi:hypothetical protein